ncbi:MAG: CBS domain-containing protein [Vicinamibacterales bacterium]
MSNSARFLTAFAAIEKHLRIEAAADRGEPFYRLVDVAAKRSQVVRRYRDDLQEYADLRNAIVHERAGGQPIAEPHADVTTNLERILEAMRNPPKVVPAFQKPVQTVTEDDTIADALKFVYPRNLSQVPVTSGQRTVGLLTTNTLSRWLARQAPVGLADLSGHTVRDALQYTEHQGNWILVSRHAHLQDVVDEFDRAEASGRRLDAVLITASGKPTEQLLGIVTIHDMPKLLRQLSPKRRVVAS